MKRKFLIALQEKIVSRSKTPWACFETDGLGGEELGVAMSWNTAFIKMLHESGIQGTTDEETLQLFFLFMSNTIANGLVGEDVVNPEATPQLTSEANQLRR